MTAAENDGTGNGDGNAADQSMVSEGDTGATQAPPATFEFLVHTLFTQAFMALGRIPNPITKQSHRNLASAKHFVDMLEMLEQKTSGNLTTEEGRLLEEIQHQLRMMYMQEAK
jgi:hypothetical protein